MTVSQLYILITQMLEKAGCDSPAFDACCLLEDVGGLPHGHRFQEDFTILSESVTAALLAAASRRAKGEPLQYILGTWDFLSLTLSVGDGVLIPRPDTEILCETVASLLPRDTASTVLDLCAGSGCVGLGIWSLCPTAQVTAVELSEKALVYLRRNASAYDRAAVCVVQDDVLAPERSYGCFDAIVSNPPYIPSDDIDGLMREVQYEPRMALDGDRDGLRFYRAIADVWMPHLRQHGMLAVEVGIGQAEEVRALFANAGLEDLRIVRDYGGVDRVVLGYKK